MTTVTGQVWVRIMTTVTGQAWVKIYDYCHRSGMGEDL